MNQGADPREVKEWLGHASLKQMEQYDHVKIGRSVSALAAIGGIRTKAFSALSEGSSE